MRLDMTKPLPLTMSLFVSQLLAELKVKHWTQRQEFELQQDRRVSDAVCDLWKVGAGLDV